MKSLSSLVELMTFRQDSFCFAIMHLRRRDEFNATVVMLVAIPFDEQLTPFSGSIEIFKPFGLIIRTVLKCLKELFCIR